MPKHWKHKFWAREVERLKKRQDGDPEKEFAKKRLAEWDAWQAKQKP